MKSWVHCHECGQRFEVATVKELDRWIVGYEAIHKKHGAHVLKTNYGNFDRPGHLISKQKLVPGEVNEVYGPDFPWRAFLGLILLFVAACVVFNISLHGFEWRRWR